MEKIQEEIQLAKTELKFQGKQITIDESQKINLDISEKISILFWMKFSKPQTSAIVAKMNNDGTDFFKGWNVLLRKDEGKSTIVFQLIHQYPQNLVEVRTTEFNELKPETWYHIAITNNGSGRSSGIQFFIDGKLVSLKTEFNSLTKEISNDWPITLGARTNGLIFEGNINDLRMLKTKLTNQEIIKIFDNSKIKFGNKEVENFDSSKERKTLIDVKKVSRIFKIYHERPLDIFSKIKSIISKQVNSETLLVLDNISFELKEGEMLGILGRNGSGKTTLLKIIGNILNPSSGKITVNGKMSSFLSLGSGFNPDLTAKNNIILYGMILGESKKEMERKVESIIKFAELEDFVDVKIKNFSTGMNMRLAFSTAISVNPDILLVDEVLSVGDYSFQQKSLDAFLKIKNSGKGIVFVSHSLEQLEGFCDRIILLEKGKIIYSGEPEVAIIEYKKLMRE
jgi:ABC-type polysaccharide/polyol phosphate transport system ATPase subunit